MYYLYVYFVYSIEYMYCATIFLNKINNRKKRLKKLFNGFFLFSFIFYSTFRSYFLDLADTYKVLWCVENYLLAMKCPTPRAKRSDPTIRPLVEVRVATTRRVNITPNLNISRGTRNANLFIAWWTNVRPTNQKYLWNDLPILFD